MCSSDAEQCEDILVDYCLNGGLCCIHHGVIQCVYVRLSINQFFRELVQIFNSLTHFTNDDILIIIVMCVR